MKKIKQIKLKKAKPCGKLYRLEVFGTVTDPPSDPDTTILKGPCMIYTDEGVHFARLYPVKEADSNKCETCAYKREFEALMELPDCNTCGSNASGFCGFCPKPGEYTRINCPLWKPREAQPNE